MSKCDTCIHSRFNNATKTWCKYSPTAENVPGNCNWEKKYGRYESIYTIEQPIVLGTRFYTPVKDDEMKETEPIIFSMEG